MIAISVLIVVAMIFMAHEAWLSVAPDNTEPAEDAPQDTPQPWSFQ